MEPSPMYPPQGQPFAQGPTLTGPPPKAHAPLYVLAILAVAGLVGALVGVGVAAAFDDTVDTTKYAKLRERTTTTGALDEEMIDQQLAFTVTDVACGARELEGDGGYPLEAQGQYCVATITVENRTDDDFIGGAHLTGVTAAGDEVDADSYASDTYARAQGEASLMETLSGGERRTIYGVFDIPAETTLAALLLNDTFPQESYGGSEGVRVAVD
jgi:hypothetical protein